MRTSILGTFFLASEAEKIEGIEWYERAHRLACTLGRQSRYNVIQCAAVIAVLSPQNPWERNCIDAENMVMADDPSMIKVGTFNANKQKAIRILNGEAPLDVLGGLKVRDFYRSIMGSQDAVCVDGHAYSIWLGERVSTTDTPKITPKMYETIKGDYISATVKINEITGSSFTPYQVQAITWVVHRNLYAGQRKPKSTKKK